MKKNFRVVNENLSEEELLKNVHGLMKERESYVSVVYGEAKAAQDYSKVVVSPLGQCLVGKVLDPGPEGSSCWLKLLVAGFVSKNNDFLQKLGMLCRLHRPILIGGVY